MTVLGTIVWLHPLLLGILSYVSYRYLPFRSGRFIVYFIVLFVAFLMDIFSLTFKIDILDIIAQRLVLFMLAEYLWSFSGIRNRLAPVVAGILVTIFLGMCTWRWLGEGPRDIQSMWTVRMDSTYHGGGSMHVLKDRRYLSTRGHVRRYILSRYLPSTPLERKVDDWVTAPGYEETQFSYAWQPNGAGVKLDLVDAGAAIWSLGEGLKDLPAKK